MSFDTAYEALADSHDDPRWAFGTGFADPLSGVDTTVPSEVDADGLAAYCLALGDDALIASHRLQQWCTHAPELEDEVALANIALDLLGQARLLLTRAGHADGSDRDEDALAFTRAEAEFTNVRLVERACADFGELVAWLLVLSTWRLAVFDRLRGDSADPVLAAIAAKAVPELTYHRDYAARWVVRLGDGTDYSHERMRAGLAAVWPDVAELFGPVGTEAALGPDPGAVRAEFDEVLGQVCAAATLPLPETPTRGVVAGRGGRAGVHTEAMGYVLAELQSIHRALPGATW